MQISLFKVLCLFVGYPRTYTIIGYPRTYTIIGYPCTYTIIGYPRKYTIIINVNEKTLGSHNCGLIFCFSHCKTKRIITQENMCLFYRYGCHLAVSTTISSTTTSTATGINTGLCQSNGMLNTVSHYRSLVICGNLLPQILHSDKICLYYNTIINISELLFILGKCVVSCRLFFQVLLIFVCVLEMQIKCEKCWSPFFWFSPATLLYLSQFRTRFLMILILQSCLLINFRMFFYQRKLKLKIFRIISSPCQRQCELLPSLGVRRLSSVNFSHFNLLL